MHRTQIFLTKNEKEQLFLIAKETEQYQMKRQNKRDALDAAAGIWKERESAQPLPDFNEIRIEFDR